MLVLHVPLIKDETTETIQNSYYSGASISGNSVSEDASSPLERRFSMTANATVEFHPRLNKSTKISMAYWLKKPGNESISGWGNWTVGLSTTRLDDTNGVSRFRMEFAINSPSNYALFNNGNFTGDGSAFSLSIPINTWIHFVLSADTETGDWEYWLYNLNTGKETHVTGKNTITSNCYFRDVVQINKPSEVTELDYADLRVYNHRVSQYEVDQMRKRLVCQYSFDSIDDSLDCSDYSTMGNDAEACKVIVSPNNKIGYTCAQFDGAEYVVLPATCKLTSKFTCNFWGYMDDWTTYTGMRMISCTEGGGWNIEDSGQSIWMSCYDGTAKTYQGAGYVTKASLTSGWHMFTCQFDGTNAKFYVDGNLKAASKAYQGAPSGVIGYNSGNRIFLGCEAAGNANPGGSYFKGKLDDFKMWASVLTEADIKKEYTTRAIVDNKSKLYTKWLNEVEVGYSKYNLVIPSPLHWQYAGVTLKESPDMNFYEFKVGGDPLVAYDMKIPKPIPNHKYYGAVIWRTLPGNTSSDNRFEWWCGDTTTKDMIFAAKSDTNGQAIKVSGIKSMPVVDDGTWVVRNFIVNSNTKTWTSDPIIVDLTEIFGVGNEPDKEWCDKNIIMDPVNLISDPSFENFTVSNTHSSGRYGNAVSYDAYEGNNSLEIASDSGSEMTCGLGWVANWRPMHKYYWGAWIKRMTGTAPASGNCYMQPQAGTAEPFQGNFPYGPADGNWYYCSFITRDACFTHTNFTTAWNETYGQSTVRLDLDGIGKVRYDCLQQIDLTALYGWGNEPTLAECDKLFGYKTSKIQLCDEKGVTNINQISEMGRPMRYLRLTQTGSTSVSDLADIRQLYVNTVDNGKIMLCNCLVSSDLSKCISFPGVTPELVSSGDDAYFSKFVGTSVWDMGKIDFVASVWLQRYFKDGRSYYGTKLEGSIDKSTWFTIWDSHNTKNGYNTYPETRAGRTFIVEADKIYITDKGTIIVNEIEEY